MSQTVGVPVSFDELLLVPPPPQAAAIMATATETTVTNGFRWIIWLVSPSFENAAPSRHLGGRLPQPPSGARPPAGRRPSVRCGCAEERGRRPGDNGRRGRWSGRTRRSALTRRR